MAPFTSGTSGNPHGRPELPAEKRRVRMTVVVAPETQKWIRARAAALDESLGAIIDELVRRMRTRK